MIEPTVALATAIRSRLINTPAVTALVPPEHIRAGTTRPDKLPTILMANGQTVLLGNAAGGQLVARVFLDLHIWAREAGAETAQAIGAAVLSTLRTAPGSVDFVIDEYDPPAVRWMRDPDPDKNLTHGVMTIGCAMRFANDGTPIGTGDTGAPTSGDLPSFTTIFEEGLA